MPRPELQAPPEIFYNDSEARKYTTSSRIIEIQARISERALELLNLPDDGVPKLLLDIGCGSGLSGETLSENGHHWVGYDISPSMLDIALEREAEGDLLLGDMGQGLGLRPGVFDGAISISAVQWLCYADKSSHEPRMRLKAFFGSLYKCLARGARAVLQIYAENMDQSEMIMTYAMRAGFSGGVVVDWPHSSKARKAYLVLTCGPASLQTSLPKGKGEDGEMCSDEDGSDDSDNGDQTSMVGVYERNRPRKKLKVNKKGKTKGKQWILRKKEQRRNKTMDVPLDSKYTAQNELAQKPIEPNRINKETRALPFVIKEAFIMASLCTAASLPHCSASASASASTICRPLPPQRIRPRGGTSASSLLRFLYLSRGQWSGNRALCFNVKAKNEGEGQGEDEESLTDALLSSVRNDSDYLLKAAAGSVGGASAIKYGSILFPDVTRPNIIQGLLMVSLPVVVAVLILLKESFSPTQKTSKKEQAKAGSESNLDPETLFSVFDRDGDGYITSKELEESFNRLGFFANTKEVLSEIQKVDINNDGLIDLDEFRKLYHLVLGDGIHKTRDIFIEEATEEDDDDDDDEERELKGAFSIFDRNGDGMISADELQEILTALGLKKGERIEDCTDMINKVDMNGDGMVNFEEFKRMMAFKGGKYDSSNVIGSLLTS